MYDFTIKESSRELSKKDKAKLVNLAGIISLDKCVPNDKEIIIKPIDYVIIDVHNENSKNNKDYSNYIIFTEDGQVYRTGSTSFWESFKMVWDIFNDESGKEEFELCIYKSPSKNYEGKFYLTCTAV